MERGLQGYFSVNTESGETVGGAIPPVPNFFPLHQVSGIRREQVPAKGTVRSKIGNAVAKGKEFGKNVAEKAKAAGAKAKAAGLAAKAHVGRNKAAYIAGGLGAAAGATGIALASRKNKSQSD